MLTVIVAKLIVDGRVDEHEWLAHWRLLACLLLASPQQSTIEGLDDMPGISTPMLSKQSQLRG